jgi:plastocyanin
MPKLSPVAVLATLLVLSVAGSAAAATKVARPPVLPDAIPHVDYDGIEHLKYRFGPIQVKPGQNDIKFALNRLKPQVPGYITRFEPNLVRADGSVPPVDELHLHHGVWLMRGYPTFAAGEEKTITQMPQGFGYRYDPSDGWVMNHMVHNLLPNKDVAYLTYDIDFVPMSAPAAAGIKEVKPLWMDVAGVRGYPVFDVKRAWGGKDGKYTFPDDARGAERRKIGGAQSWTFDHDVTLIGTGGHLHPGGLYDSMFLRRGAQKKEIFRSVAKYWEPAGAVSWDVAMTVTKPAWRVAARAGDVLSISATYDTSKASWYESMGIMNLWYYDAGDDVGGVNPYTDPLETRGVVSHGHLPENDNHGGKAGALPDARRLLPGAWTTSVTIKDFLYGRGDLSLTGAAGRPPVVAPGQSITFRSPDAADDIYHTITACKEPCTATTGVAYPLADGRVDFDSGELGFGPSFATPTAQRDTWKTPKTLKAGTYTYFCRVHPFMRGAFRVKGKAKRGAGAGASLS